jgi:hypothetical protein
MALEQLPSLADRGGRSGRDRVTLDVHGTGKNRNSSDVHQKTFVGCGTFSPHPYAKRRLEGGAPAAVCLDLIFRNRNDNRFVARTNLIRATVGRRGLSVPPARITQTRCPALQPELMDCKGGLNYGSQGDSVHKSAAFYENGTSLRINLPETQIRVLSVPHCGDARILRASFSGP